MSFNGLIYLFLYSYLFMFLYKIIYNKQGITHNSVSFLFQVYNMICFLLSNMLAYYTGISIIIYLYMVLNFNSISISITINIIIITILIIIMNNK